MPDGLVVRRSRTQQARPNVRTRITQIPKVCPRTCGVASPFGRTLPGFISNGRSPVPRSNVQADRQTGLPRNRRKETRARPNERRRCSGESATGKPLLCRMSPRKQKVPHVDRRTGMAPSQFSPGIHISTRKTTATALRSAAVHAIAPAKASLALLSGSRVQGESGLGPR